MSPSTNNATTINTDPDSSQPLSSVNTSNQKFLSGRAMLIKPSFTQCNSSDTWNIRLSSELTSGLGFEEASRVTLPVVPVGYSADRHEIRPADNNGNKFLPGETRSVLIERYKGEDGNSGCHIAVQTCRLHRSDDDSDDDPSLSVKRHELKNAEATFAYEQWGREPAFVIFKTEYETACADLDGTYVVDAEAKWEGFKLLTGVTVGHRSLKDCIWMKRIENSEEYHIEMWL